MKVKERRFAVNVGAIHDLLKDGAKSEEWFDYFGTMSAAEFMDLLDEAISGAIRADFQLMLGLARKLSQHGYFSDGLSENARAEYIAKANLIVAFLAESAGPELSAPLEAAWAANIDANESFGYKSGPIFDILRPYKAFSDS